MKYLFSWLLFISISVFSQNITLEINTDTIKVGERFNIKATVNGNINDTILWLKIDSLFNDFELIKSSQKLSFIDFDTFTYKNYLFTAFDTGEFVFPSTSVFLKDDTLLTNSFNLTVLPTQIDTLSDVLRDVKPQKKVDFLFGELKYYWHYLVLLFCVLLVLFFIVFVYIKAIKKAMTFREYLFYLFEKYFSRKKREEKIMCASDFLKKLNNIESYFNNDIYDKYHNKELYIDLSECFRGYVEYRFDIPALESDSQDLKLLLKELNLKESWFNDFFRACDLIKFAKATPLKQDSVKFLKMVRNFINVYSDKITEEELLNDKNK
mgnify:CR=1 FL=1